MPHRRLDHLAALRDCLPSLGALCLGIVGLALGLFVIDPTPHTGPLYPASHGLTLGAGLAVVVMSAAIVVRYREHIAAARRRREDAAAARGWRRVCPLRGSEAPGAGPRTAAPGRYRATG